MKKILFILGIAFSFHAMAQQTSINYNSIDTLNYPVNIYGLDSTKYFSKAKQVDLRKFPTYVSIIFERHYGCIGYVRENVEIFFDGSIGYILHSKNGTPDTYFNFTNREIIVGILKMMNQTFAFDSTILLKNPYSNDLIITGSGGGVLEIDITFLDGEHMYNKIIFGDIYNYSKYLPTLYHYLMELNQDSSVNLNYKISKMIVSKFKSKIATNFIQIMNKPQDTLQPIQSRELKIDKRQSLMRLKNIQ